MRLIFTVLLALFIYLPVQAQFNTRLLSNLEYDLELNDIWGYVAPDGTEYALVGTTRGLSIVELSDPQNPEEVAFVPGAFSIWRDIKTFGEFAFITVDQPRTKEGLRIIDLRELPERVSATNWRPSFNSIDTLNTCHNLYIDQQGIAYLAGCNLNDGGIIMVDISQLATEEPKLLGFGPNIYAHDVYVQDKRIYASELFRGQLGIYDAEDPTDVNVLTQFQTPYRFTHNAWASLDGNYVFTTDERAGAPVAAFDISNLNNVTQTDEYRVPASPELGIIPHNVHVLNQWLAISYYTEGARFVDASRPDNLIEVAYYDTFNGTQTGFSGAWGLYPFLPSGLQLISDIDNGLFIIDVNLVRAAYLEGLVTEVNSGIPISDVDIKIIADQQNSSSSARDGTYQTGLGMSGTFEVVFSHPEYESKTVTVELTPGEVTELNVQLKSIAPVTISGRVLDRSTNAPIPGAFVRIANENFVFQVQADGNGRFQLEEIIQESYDVFSGAWGYRHKKLNKLSFSTDASLTILLEQGYEDDFIFDLGWESSGDASNGQWVRGVPDGVRFDGVAVSPPFDISGDLGAQCYLTDNSGGAPGQFDVDSGSVTLVSPLIDLSDYRAPEISYYLWFYGRNGSTAPDDALRVYLSNGADTILLESVTSSNFQWRPQSVIPIGTRIELTNTMRLIVQTGDTAESDHLVEAGIDAFAIREGQTTSLGDPSATVLKLQAFPNPFSEQIRIQYQLPEFSSRAFIRVFNTLGQELNRIPLNGSEGTLELGRQLPTGAYYLFLEVDGQRGPMRKVVKM